MASVPSFLPATLATSAVVRLSILVAAERRPSWCASRTCAELVALALMNMLVIRSKLTLFVSRPHSSTKSLNSAISISIASSAVSEPRTERQYARKMRESSWKCF